MMSWLKHSNDQGMICAEFPVLTSVTAKTTGGGERKGIICVSEGKKMPLHGFGWGKT